MIVFHALWEYRLTNQLHIWAESSQLTMMPRRSGKTGAQKKARHHPFTLACEALQEEFGKLFGSLLAASATAGSLTLCLPSSSRAPLPSPELILEREAEEEVTLLPWQVETLALEAGAALDFLLALHHEAPHGVAFGSSLAFWREVANFVLALLSRQSYAPVLHERRHNGALALHAAWEAVLSDTDAGRLSVLAKAMPPVCWSFTGPGEMRVSGPREMLLQFLNRGIDAFVRDSLTQASIVPARRDRRALSLPEQWLRALSSEDATLIASPAALKSFADSMRSWLDQLRPVESNAPFRTCFRLAAPESEEDGQWQLSFHLQANDDRSLLVPAEIIWKERSGTLTFLKRKFENPQERLLADLGRASRLFPALEQSLQTARPSELLLSTDEAYSFLREAAPLLEQSGFGVLVPAWWQKPAARLGAKLKLKAQANAQVSTGLMTLENVISYDWTAAIGDTTLTAKEFERLVRLKRPLVQVRGQWVELRPEEIEKAIAFFRKKRANGQMSLTEALRLGLGQEISEVGLPVISIEGEGWIDDMLKRLSDPAALSLIEPPRSFHGQLRPYQQKGLSWLAFLKQLGLGACLADDMGLGKCASGDTLIVANGLMRKAEDIWHQYAGETTFDGEGYWAEPTEQLLVNSIDETSGRIVQAPIKRLYRQQVRERLRKVQLEDGSSVTITYAHKLLTDKGWTNDLHVGDYLCVPAKLIWDGKPEDPDLVKFLAWQIAEGYEVQNPATFTITQKDTAVLRDLQQCLRRIGEKPGIKINAPSITLPAHKSAYLRVSSAEYRKFLEAKGYQWGKLSREKSIPDFIMQADLDTVRIFLRNFFEAEASVVESMRSIEISTASPVLIQQLSCLLRRFGIWMRVSTKEKRATNGSGIYRPYRIGILDGNAARKFCREIGFAGERKQRRLEEVCAKVSNTNVEGIPVISTFDTILSGEAERIYKEKAPSKWMKQTLAAYTQLDRQLLVVTKSKLQRLLEQEVYYCKIKEIEDVEYDGWVYDFEVEDHHNFVANNILCHNTIQLISLLLHDRENGLRVSAPTLLICPMSIVGNWHRELQRFAPSLSVMVHHGHDRLAGEAFVEEAQRHDVVITTYALALRDKEDVRSLEWEYVVVDEAQNIKNEVAKQTQAIKSLNARHRIALTGTPVENRLSELWSIMEFLNPGYLGSGQDFRKQFALPIERYHNAEKAETLKRLVQPFVLRRLKTDKAIIRDLPDKMEMKVFCNLTQEQASLYEAVVQEMLEKIEEADGIERRGLVLAALMKLKQVCNHPAHFIGDGSRLAGRSGKLARLEEMLEEVLAEGDKALIFTQFAEMGAMLRQHLQETLGCEVLFLHGGTNKKQRDLMVQRFQEEKRGAPIFILSLKAGGVGLNLTAANHVFHFDRWWNPAVENQATDRAFRIGQQRNVQVHKFVCVGTLEERIDAMIEQKKELAERIIGSGENWLSELSTAELKELFRLSREAVVE